jgi:hypothetical protein
MRLAVEPRRKPVAGRKRRTVVVVLRAAQGLAPQVPVAPVATALQGLLV